LPLKAEFFHPLNAASVISFEGYDEQLTEMIEYYFRAAAPGSGTKIRFSRRRRRAGSSSQGVYDVLRCQTHEFPNDKLKDTFVAASTMRRFPFFSEFIPSICKGAQENSCAEHLTAKCFSQV
jgi:hypothetical protein